MKTSTWFEQQLQNSIDYADGSRNYENIKKMLEKLDDAFELVECDDITISDIEKTSGGENGYGNSYLIKARYKDNTLEFVLAKISDHSKFDAPIQLFDWMSIKEMAEQFNEDDINQILSDEELI